MSSHDYGKSRFLTAPYRWLLMAAAVLSLGVGLVGVVVPGLPTTVFVLLAAWLAARSSPALSVWLDNHHLTGPIIRHWREGRCIPKKAKFAAAAGMTLSVVIMWFSSMPFWAFLPTVVVMTVVLVWLWRLPEPPVSE